MYFKEYNSIEKDKKNVMKFLLTNYVHTFTEGMSIINIFFFETLIRVKRKPRILIIIFFHMWM